MKATSPLIEKSDLDYAKNIFQWLLIILGAASFLLPDYIIFFGAIGIPAFFIGYFISRSYRKYSKSRLEKARKAQIKIEPFVPKIVSESIKLYSDALLVASLVQSRPLIKERTVGLGRSFSEFNFHVNEGEKLHIKWDSDKPFVLHLLDSWHSSRSDFTTTLFSEPLAVKGEETIPCLKTDRLTLLMASTAKYQDPRVTIKVWIE